MFPRAFTRGGFWAALIAVALVQSASADLTDYSVFGATGVTTNSENQIHGLVGSGMDLSAGWNSTLYDGARAGRHFNPGSAVHTPGDVIANGNVNLPWSSTVGGDVTAGGTVTLAGNVTPGGTVQSNAGTPYSPVPALPSATVFTAGGAGQYVGDGGTLTLAPGTYGSLSTDNESTVNLSAGTYYFDGVYLGNKGRLNLDVTAGDIQIYSLGNVGTNSEVVFNVIGGSAGDVYVESHGNVDIGWKNDVHGTFFASGTGGISTNSELGLYGALYSANSISLGWANVVNFEVADAFAEKLSPVPVPGAALLGLLGLGVAGAKLRRRAQESSR